MEEKILQIKKEALTEIEQVKNQKELDEIRNKYLSRASELNNLKKGLKDVAPELRPKIGALTNEVSKEIEALVNKKAEEFYQIELNKKLEAEKIDVTLPSTYEPYGHIHPLTKTTNEIVEIFEMLGFSLIKNEYSPEVEVEKYNFDLLNVPKEHPARDVQDTFYSKLAKNVILRSQTSNAQVRQMQNSRPPIKIISPGRVYRSESVSARKNNLFHQIEGLYVDKNVTFGDLKGVLNEFIRLYFGSSRPTRFRNSFFPFTEPSAEVDVQCIMCHGKGCPTCSGTGWLEILGSGMVDPNVLRAVDIDPDVYTGFAFGMGIERLTMLKYAIDDIRLFFNNDIRFLNQF
ncbi:TPA: phenylalanine--tRNA ligase subunit alpha [Candidatus Galligastranaerophilus intestinigallinarum]|nr:phenylalanine--tRNA ligase subunit alpha [Candidatus Galligastranaerophilus intestinigallinarum]